MKFKIQDFLSLRLKIVDDCPVPISSKLMIIPAMDHSCHAGTYPLKMARTDYILGCVTVMLPLIAEWGYVSPLPRANAETSTRKKIPRWLTKLSLFFFFWENEQRCKTLPILYFTWPLSPYNAHIHRCRGRGQIVANRNHKQKTAWFIHSFF